MRFWWLMLCVSQALATDVPETSFYYFGAGKEMGVQGKVDDTLFIMGKHTLSPKQNQVSDTQVIVSRKTGIFEEVIRYDLTHHRVVIYVGKRSIGEGDFQTDGDPWKWKKCHYRLQLSGDAGGMLEGTDNYSDGDSFVVAETKMSGPKGEIVNRFTADLKSIDADLYETLRIKLLGNFESRLRGKGPRD